MRDWTPLLIVILPPALGLLDVALYQAGGNDATFSKVMLDARQRNPLVALSTSYTLCVMLGHFFFPVEGVPPPAYEVIGRMVVVLSPTVYALIVIGADNGAAAAHKRWLDAGGPSRLATAMTATGIAGGLVGALVLPQHLSP